MNVAQLIEVLQKVENQSVDVVFWYDSRAAGRLIRSVMMNEYGEVVLLEEDAIEYGYNNPNFTGQTEEEYRSELIAEQKRQLDDPLSWWHSLSTSRREEMMKKSFELNMKEWRRKKEETKDHITLFVEGSND